MNEMYNMSIVAHNFGVMMLCLVVFINFLLLKSMGSLKKYKRVLSLYNPIAFTAIGTVMFTGIVMMAAKHLDFTVENIAMIAVAIIYIYLEFTRLKELRAEKKEFRLEFKKRVTTIFMIEFLLIIIVVGWMWII